MGAFRRRRIGRTRGLIVSFRQRAPCDERSIVTGGWAMQLGSGLETFAEKPIAGASRGAVFCRPRAGPLDHSSTRTSPFAPAGDRDAARQSLRCAARGRIRGAGAAVAAGRSRRRSAGRSRRAGISDRDLRRFSHQDRRGQRRGASSPPHHRPAGAAPKAGQVERSLQRRRPLLRHAGARSSFSRARHHDDDVIARAAALPASVAFGHVRRIPR